MPRLPGSLATAQKTPTVAEGYRTRRFILSIWFVSFVWLNQTDLIDQMSLRNRDISYPPNLRFSVGMALAGLV